MDHRFDKPQVLTPFRSLRQNKTFSPSNKLDSKKITNNNASVGPEVNSPFYIEDEGNTRTPNVSPNLFPSPPFTPPPSNIRPNKNTLLLHEVNNPPKQIQDTPKIVKEDEIRNEENTVIIKPTPSLVKPPISFISTPKVENKKKKILTPSTNNQILEFYTPPPKEEIRQEKITYTSIEPIIIKKDTLNSEIETKSIKRTIRESELNEYNEEIKNENIKPNQASKWPLYIPFNWKTFLLFGIIQITSFLIYTLIMWLFVWCYIKDHYSIRTTENGELSVNSLSIYKGDFKVNDIYTDTVVNEMNSIMKSTEKNTLKLTKQLMENKHNNNAHMNSMNNIKPVQLTAVIKEKENDKLRKSSKSLRNNDKNIDNKLTAKYTPPATYDTTHHLSINPNTDDLYIASQRLTSDELLVEGNSYFKGNIIMGDPLKNTTILVNGNIVFNTHNITVKNINIENGLISNSQIKGNSIVFDRNANKYKIPFINDEGKFEFSNHLIFSNDILTTKSLQSKEINNIENINKLEPSVLHIYDSIKTTNYLFEEGNNKFTIDDGLISDNIHTLYIESKSSDPITLKSDLSGNNINKISNINRIEVNELKSNDNINDEILKIKSDVDFGSKSIKTIERIENMKEMTVGTVNIENTLHIKSIDNKINNINNLYNSIDFNSDINMKNNEIKNIKSISGGTLNIGTIVQSGNSDNSIKISSKMNFQNIYGIININEVDSLSLKVKRIESKDTSLPIEINSNINMNNNNINKVNEISGFSEINIKSKLNINGNDIENIKSLTSSTINIKNLHVEVIDNNANSITINSDINMNKIMKVNTIESVTDPNGLIELKSDLKTDKVITASNIKVDNLESINNGKIKVNAQLDIGTNQLIADNLRLNTIYITKISSDTSTVVLVDKDINFQNNAIYGIKEMSTNRININTIQSSVGGSGTVSFSSDLDLLNMNNIVNIKDLKSDKLYGNTISITNIQPLNNGDTSINILSSLNILNNGNIYGINEMSSGIINVNSIKVNTIESITTTSTPSNPSPISLLSSVDMNSNDLIGINNIKSVLMNVKTVESDTGTSGTIAINSNIDMNSKDISGITNLSSGTINVGTIKSSDGLVDVNINNDLNFWNNCGVKNLKYFILPNTKPTCDGNNIGAVYFDAGNIKVCDGSNFYVFTYSLTQPPSP